MKKRFLVIAALIGLLVSCRNPAEGSPDDPNNPVNPVNPGQKAVIVFDNTQGICSVAVYDYYLRRDDDKITEIPAGAKSPEIPWTPGASVPFYFSYPVSFRGSSGLALNLIPNPKSEKGQTTVSIDADTITTIPVPALNETVSSPDALLSDDSYLIIQNYSSYSFQLLRGDIINPPVNLSSPLVISGERAQYTIIPGPTSLYRLQVGADYVPFPGSSSFEAGHAYYFNFYYGNLSLNSELEMKLANVLTIPRTPWVAPTVTGGDRQLSLRWQGVAGANAYEVWMGTKDDSATATKWGPDFSRMPAVVTGLTNGTTYYVWIKAKNSVGTSIGFSPMASGTPSTAYSVPPQTPAAPSLSIGDRQITVTWAAAEGATDYQIWFEFYIETEWGTDVSFTRYTDYDRASLSRTFSGLTNGTTYYFGIIAINSLGQSGRSPMVSGTPSAAFNNPPSGVGLYKQLGVLLP